MRTKLPLMKYEQGGGRIITVKLFPNLKFILGWGVID